MAGHRFGPERIARVCRIGVVVVAAIMAVLCLTACTVPEETQPDAAEFDPLEMTWSPRALADATPGLMGWRTAEGAPGELVMLAPGTSGDPVVWRAPAASSGAYVDIIAVDPRGGRMVGSVYSQAAGEPPVVRSLLFGNDGRVVEIVLPEGHEGIADAAFTDDGLIAAAYHATSELYSTSLGLVTGDGTWRPLTLEGEVPEHQFVEACTARRGSDLVGLVLKVPGGPGDRDDDLIVLARLAGSTLQVVTPPYYDDYLPGARALWDTDGVTYARFVVGQPGEAAATVVRVAWTGTEWAESELAASGVISIGVESGRAVAPDPSGGYWVCSSGNSNGTQTTLVHIAGEGTSPEPVGADMSGIGWFAWVEGSD